LGDGIENVAHAVVGLFRDHSQTLPRAIQKVPSVPPRSGSFLIQPSSRCLLLARRGGTRPGS
jgi:hypothetical protein